MLKNHLIRTIYFKITWFTKISAFFINLFFLYAISVTTVPYHWFNNQFLLIYSSYMPKASPPSPLNDVVIGLWLLRLTVHLNDLNCITKGSKIQCKVTCDLRKYRLLYFGDFVFYKRSKWRALELTGTLSFEKTRLCRYQLGTTILSRTERVGGNRVTQAIELNQKEMWQ